MLYNIEVKYLSFLKINKLLIILTIIILGLGYAALDDITTGRENNFYLEYFFLFLTVLFFIYLFLRFYKKNYLKFSYNLFLFI